MGGSIISRIQKEKAKPKPKHSSGEEPSEYEGIPNDPIGRTMWNLEAIAGMTLLTSPAWLTAGAALYGLGYGVFQVGKFAISTTLDLYSSSPSIDSVVQNLQDLYSRFI
jgi:hypothetical protein